MKCCGCTIEYSHSHLVYGYECPCEKGLTKSEMLGFDERWREIFIDQEEKKYE